MWVSWRLILGWIILENVINKSEKVQRMEIAINLIIIKK